MELWKVRLESLEYVISYDDLCKALGIIYFICVLLEMDASSRGFLRKRLRMR